MKQKLDHSEIKHPYQVPNGYFEELTHNILLKTGEVDEKRRYWFAIPRVQLATSLAILAIVFISIFVLNTGSSLSFDEQLAEVSNEDIILYLAEYDLSEDDIISDNNMLIELNTPELLEEIDFENTDIDDLLIEYDMPDDAI